MLLGLPIFNLASLLQEMLRLINEYRDKSNLITVLSYSSALISYLEDDSKRSSAFNIIYFKCRVKKQSM